MTFDLTVNLRKPLVLVAWLILGMTAAWANSDLDQQYRLETIGVLKSADNVDGLFADYVDLAFQQYFSKQSRFVMLDLKSIDPVISRSKIPYDKLIYDADILTKLAQIAHADSLIRTQIQKTGKSYRFTMDWLHSKKMELLTQVEFIVEEPTAGGFFDQQFLSDKVQTQLARLIGQVPFEGQVTGRDHDSVTINLGQNEKLKKGDLLSIATIDEVKRHPLLKKVVDWRLTPTGKIAVEKIEDEMTFCKLIQEEPGKSIFRFQKIIYRQAAPVEVDSTTLPAQAEAAPVRAEIPPERFIKETPKNGWVSLSLPLGAFNRQLGFTTGTGPNLGGGFLYGTRVDSDVWLTRNWFLSGRVFYGLWSFGQKDSSTGTESPATQNGGVGGSELSYLLSVGYSHWLFETFNGPRGWLKLGYKSTKTSLPTSVVENTGPFVLGSVFLGLGAEVPFLHRWGALGHFNFKVFSFVNQSWNTSGDTSTTDLEIYLGGYYRIDSKLSVRAGFQYSVNGADFKDGVSLLQNTMTFSPAILYYF